MADDKLKAREVVHIDIANDPVLPADYKELEDPKKFKSQKTGRGPLVGADWMKKVDPVMTCYKLVTCEFKWFGLQTRIEQFIQRSERRLFTTFHRYESEELSIFGKVESAVECHLNIIVVLNSTGKCSAGWTVGMASRWTTSGP